MELNKTSAVIKDNREVFIGVFKRSTPYGNRGNLLRLESPNGEVYMTYWENDPVYTFVDPSLAPKYVQRSHEDILAEKSEYASTYRGGCG